MFCLTFLQSFLRQEVLYSYEVLTNFPYLRTFLPVFLLFSVFLKYFLIFPKTLLYVSQFFNICPKLSFFLIPFMN